MTTPWPDPPGTPEPRTEMSTGSALYLGHPHVPCRECGETNCPDWFDHDRQYRGSETTWRRVAAR